MHKNPLNLAVFLVGLVAIGWIGAGYATTNPVAALVAAVIGACYLAGVAERKEELRFTRLDGQPGGRHAGAACRLEPASEPGLECTKRVAIGHGWKALCA